MAYDDAGTSKNIWDEDAQAYEAALIGGIMFEPRYFERLSINLEPEEFRFLAHQVLWKEICELRQFNRPCTGYELGRIIDRFPQYFLEVGGRAYLQTLLDHASVFWMECDSFARIVRDNHVRHGYKDAALAFASACDHARDATDAYEEFLERKNHFDRKVIELVNEPERSAEELFDETDAPEIFPTGIGKIDRMTGGLERCQMTVLAGGTTHGKTAVGIQILANALMRGESVGYFSIDMTDTVIWQRLCCCIAYAQENIPIAQAPLYNQAQKRELTEQQRDELKRCHAMVKDRFMISSKPRIRADEIERQIHSWQLKLRQNGQPPLSCVIVDHLGKMGDDTTSNSTYERVSLRSARLLDVAKRNPGLAMVVMVQFSRDYSKNNRRPVISDLRDSGTIEEDANAVVMVFREEVRQKAIAENEMIPQEERQKAQNLFERARGNMEIIIGKNRLGETGTAIIGHQIGYNSIGKFD